MVNPKFWLIRCVVLIGLTVGCATADDFAEDQTLTRAEAGDPVAAVEADSADSAKNQMSNSGSALPSDRPVLEVTSQATIGPADHTAGTTATVLVDAGDGSSETIQGPGQPDTDGPETDGGHDTTTQPASVEATSATTAAASVTETTSNTDSTHGSATTAPPPADNQTTPQPTPAPTTATPAPNPSGTEPNCNVSCNIAMEGDSLTVGLGNRLCQVVQTGNCINSGIVGRRVDEMIVTAKSDVDNQLGSGANDVLILWGGTNDLWQKFHSQDPAANAAAIYEQIKLFVSERRTAGWDRVYVMTLPPMNPQYVVGTEPLNDLIRQNGAGADGVIDVGADARLANAFDPAMRAADGIHFGDGGRAVVMEHILATIGRLDGA